MLRKALISIFFVVGVLSCHAQLGGYVGPGGSGGGPENISTLTYSADDSTIVASWNTIKGSDSHLSCGGKLAVDDGVETNVKFHQAVVTGLSPATGYSCFVTSGATSSTPQTVTTAAAQTKTPITSATIGTGTQTGPSGDTLYNVVSNDNKTYTVLDDSSGLDGCCSANMSINVFTNESTFAGTTVNAFANFGAQGATSGTDGPSGEPLNNKGGGLFGMLGNLYYFANRDQYVGQFGATKQLTWYGNWMRSTNHGVSWNTWQNPNGYLNAGTLPNPLGSYMWATKLYGWCVPTKYAMDDGTLGYTTPGNRIDGANAFVYISCTDGNWNNSSNLYLTRIPRVQFDAQNPGAIQYWIGPSSPTSAQFVSDSNWSSAATSATAIYTAANQTSSQDMVFVPALNYYLLTEWYQPNSSNTAVSNWQILAGPTPAGPWTQVGTAAWTTQGYYNPTFMHRTAATNTATTNVGLTLLYTGYGSFYHPTYSTLTLNPVASLLIDATAPATFAGSVAHQLRTAYSGPLVRIQRASDSTQMDVPQTGTPGVLNTATITSFCSGTTCNVATIYDQSGNAHNATQTVFANMPIIYTGGAVVTNGVKGQPSAKWDNTQRFLSASIAFSGSTFESVGVGTLGAAGPSGYAGFATMTDGAHSGGSTSGLVDLLDENNTAQSVAAGYVGCGLPTQGITYGTQFQFDSANVMTSTGTCNLAINGGTFATNSFGSPISTTATILLLGSDAPTTTYYWNGFISDTVVYSTVLTGPQRTAAHTVESSYFGTP